ncbi:DUF3427 domain-containing protein [Paenibacillus herberti]|uniref:NgoFVII family restriction endonuclease n=1 Tax=Paenibacillus herberti TaxID=1619309 RepID=A0A229NWC0_9BACL|nr:DEAD/DEAH box helicase [Paenibacillus herberti]OXM13939.1 NgoFVII family restriction endonuclease [Paenibacillus herberti]
MKLGLYEQLINQLTRKQLSELDPSLYEIGIEALDAEEARKQLSNYLAAVTRRALKMVREQSSDDAHAVLMQVRACNDIIESLKSTLGHEELKEWQLDERGELLTYVYSKLNHIRGIKETKINRPTTPLSQSSLFTGAHSEPNMMSELKQEIVTSDRIDLLVSFIKWSGLRCLIEQLEQFTSNGGHLRVITTTYMEATDYKAVIELGKLQNTEIKVSYDTDRTRLHAKAYLFQRDTGFTTAYVGSSNLSNPALTSGLEWNLKVTERDSYDVLKKIEATFESYWNDREFKAFDPTEESNQTLLRQALSKSKMQGSAQIPFHFTLTPYDYQKEILEKLEAQRVVYGRTRNLLVAATGVGKTVISAFDYKRFAGRNPRARLLFVAHREEILKQSLDTFRFIMKDLNFGELQVGSNQAGSVDHLFISIQSFNSIKLAEKTTLDFYDYIVVDEFHHATAPSYNRLLAYYEPKLLLGLTATPERMDGKDILHYFDDTIAAEIRLTDAIDRKLLAPFHYFGVTDNIDLSQVKWSRRGYDLNELEQLYTHNKIRASQILTSLKKYTTDINEVKALGFCVSVDHALYMAKVFNESGISAIALHGRSTDEERNTAKGKLVSGDVKVIFVVDLYNEGVDIPEVNTVLFLRPTESMTVFLQQLGRGLRLADRKECLTVLDFIGQAHQEYRFQDKFRALLGKTKHSIQHYVEHGFSSLPRGSFVQLEKQARDYILRNLKQATINRRNLIGKIKYFTEDSGLSLTLDNFTRYHNMSLYEFYGGRNGNRTLRGLMAEAGLLESLGMNNMEPLIKRIPALLSMNSRRILGFLIAYIEGEKEVETEEEHLMLNLFYYTFFRSEPSKQGFNDISQGVQFILENLTLREEILEILKYNYAHITFVDKRNKLPYPCPLDLHCNYSTDQILAAFGVWNEEKAPSFREGVKYLEEKATDIFFITLNKSDKDFSPSTLYEDYAINERLFHWQTQSRISEETNTAKRYIQHKQTGNRIVLFVREFKEENNYTSSFVFLGEAEYVRHEGNKPMSFVWKLKHEMPPELVPVANKAIG